MADIAFNEAIGGKVNLKNYVNKNKTDTTTAPKVTTPTVTTPTTNPSLQLNDLYDQRMKAAYDAYNNGINRLNDSYNTAANNYGNIYNKGVSTLNNSYKNSLNKINDNAQQSMQEAYINRMLSQKNLSQQLAAQGLSGGASESAMAGLINNYGNARNGIQRTWDSNRSDLENTLQQNINNLYSAYQSQMANLDMNRANALNNLENMLANRQADVSDSWFSALMSNPSLLNNAVSSASAKQSAYTPTTTEATNIADLVNTTQSNDIGNATQVARTQALRNEGNAITNYLDEVNNPTRTTSSIWANILNSINTPRTIGANNGYLTGNGNGNDWEQAWYLR